MSESEFIDKLRSYSVQQPKKLNRRQSGVYCSLLNVLDLTPTPKRTTVTINGLERFLSDLTDVMNIEQQYTDSVQQTIKKMKEVAQNQTNEKNNAISKLKFQLYTNLVNRNLNIKRHISSYIQHMKIKGKYNTYSFLRNAKQETLRKQRVNSNQRINKTFSISNQTSSTIRVNVQSIQDSGINIQATNVSPGRESKLLKENIYEQPFNKFKNTHRELLNHLSTVVLCPSQSNSPLRRMKIQQQESQRFISQINQIYPRFPTRQANAVRYLQNNSRPNSQQKMTRTSNLLTDSRTIRLTFDNEVSSGAIHRRPAQQKYEQDLYFKLMGKLYERNTATLHT